MKFAAMPMKVGQDTASSLRFYRRVVAPRVGSLTEMDLGRVTALPLAQRVLTRALYRIFSKDIGTHSQEIPLLLRRTPFVKVRRFRLLPFTPDVGDKGTGNDRYVAILEITAFGRDYAIFAIHFDAVIQNHNPGSPAFGDFLDNERWAVTKKAMPQLAIELTRAQSHNDAVVVLGDSNILPVGEGLTNPFSIYNLLRRLGFSVDNERVTILGTWGLEPSAPAEVYLPGRNGWGSDHAGLARKFKRPTKKH